MRIKLIFPDRKLRDTEMVVKNHLVPSETLTAIAAATPAKHTVMIVDENVQRLDLNDSPDLVGITVYTFSAPRAYEIADGYRAKGVHVVLGGLHVTGRPDDALPHADTIIIGEAEGVWSTFLEDLEQGKAERVYQPQFVADLNTLPCPRKDLLREHDYLTVASISASRGCPHNCAYCFNSVKPKAPFRKRSVDSVLSQIQRERDTYYIFFDDNLAGDRNYARELCRGLKTLDIKWRCAASIDLAYDEDLVRQMSESGCDSIFIGLESVNGGSLDESFKHQNRRNDYEKLLKVFRAHGILVNAAFVFGFDHDTPSVFRDTVEFAIANKIASVNFHILVPFPGTCLFNRLEKEGRILSYHWADYDTGHVVFRPKAMTPAQLVAGYEWVYKELYSWRNIFRRALTTSLRYSVRSLIFNIALKKMNWAWRLFKVLGLLHTVFHLYYSKRPFASWIQRSAGWFRRNLPAGDLVTPAMSVVRLPFQRGDANKPRLPALLSADFDRYMIAEEEREYIG